MSVKMMQIISDFRIFEIPFGNCERIMKQFSQEGQKLAARGWMRWIRIRTRRFYENLNFHISE